MKKSQLHEYQKTGVKHILSNPFCGLFLDMGLGKTVTTLTAINCLIYEELELAKVLIIAPKRVAEHVWTSEVEKWKHLKNLKLSKVVGNETGRIIALKTKADVYIISRDNVAWLCGLYGGNMLPFNMLVIDESSSFKNPKALRFKALRRVQPSFERVLLLTGTPAPNGLVDLWSQLYLLDRGDRLGKTIGAYRSEYFNPGQRNGHIIYNYQVKNTGEKRIYSQIEDICISMKAEDHLRVSEAVDNSIELIMSEKTKNRYKEFEKEQVLSLLEGGEITAANAAALSGKLLQFANGAIYDEEKDWHEVHDLKLEAIEEVIENANGKPVLVAWTFRHDLTRLLTRLKRYNPRQLKTTQDIDAWNRGEIQILLMHPASGGHGLNLQSGGNIVVWFGQTWSSELYQQLNARLCRQGQLEKQVIIHHLVVKDTLDVEVIKSRKNKVKTQDGLLEAIKARLEHYIVNR